MLSAGEIVAGLGIGVPKRDTLPIAHKAADGEAKRQCRESENVSHGKGLKWRAGLTGAARDLERRGPGAACRGMADAGSGAGARAAWARRPRTV